MRLPAINIEKIKGGEVTFKWDIRNKFTGLETRGGGGVVSGQVYIIKRAKGKGGGRTDVIQCGICYGSEAIKGGIEARVMR